MTYFFIIGPACQVADRSDGRHAPAVFWSCGDRLIAVCDLVGFFDRDWEGVKEVLHGGFAEAPFDLSKLASLNSRIRVEVGL